MLSKLIFALILVSATVLSAKKRFDLELHNVCCNYTFELASTFICNVSRLATNRYSLSGLVEFRRPPHPNTEIAVCIHYRLPKMDRKVKFIDIRMKLCDIMSSIQRIPLLRDVLVEIRRSSNFPLTCPFKENFVYNYSNMIITNDLLPPYMMHLHFNSSVLFYEHQLQVGYYNLSGSIVPNSRRG